MKVKKFLPIFVGAKRREWTRKEPVGRVPYREESLIRKRKEKEGKEAHQASPLPATSAAHQTSTMGHVCSLSHHFSSLLAQACEMSLGALAEASSEVEAEVEAAADVDEVAATCSSGQPKQVQQVGRGWKASYKL